MRPATILGLAILLAPSVARAHPLSFGALVVREGEDAVDSTLRFSGTESRPRGVEVLFPERCHAIAPATTAELPDGGVVVRARHDCGQAGLAGARLEVRGLEGTGVQIAVRVERADGTTVRALLDDGTRALTVPPHGEDGAFARYVRLGVEHIALGVDHLLFVLALVLLVPSIPGGSAPRVAHRARPSPSSAWSRERRSHGRLALTVTAFTAGHSVTLALAATSIVSAPRAAVEACIALSVLLLAHEIARPRETLTARAPWLVAGGFGLLHGLGFASALATAGLPPGAVVPALFGFNVGVELGQLAFVALALLVGRVVSETRIAAPARALTVLAIGGAASYFLLDRLAAMAGA